MKVVEIFGSIDGEGKRTGQLATFIRLAGCNLRCGYCDTTYAFNINNAEDLTVSEILKKCKEIGYHNITLTGGEPLIHPGIEALIDTLCSEGFQINIETNGSLDLTKFIETRKEKKQDLFFTVDYKSISSLMNSKMNKLSFKGLNVKKDIVKCVVSNREDMDDALKYLDSFRKKFNIWFSPVFGKIKPCEIAEYVKEHNRQDITTQIQLHKIIWDPMKKGV